MAGSSSSDGAEESREELNQRLHDAALAGDVVKLREAIAAGADVDARLPSHEVGYKSQTPLCAVVCELDVKRDRAEKGRTACVRALLAAGASASAASAGASFTASPPVAGWRKTSRTGEPGRFSV